MNEGYSQSTRAVLGDLSQRQGHLPQCSMVRAAWAGDPVVSATRCVAPGRHTP
jgi:hypothetical protein